MMTIDHPLRENPSENKAVAFPTGAKVSAQDSWAGAESLVVAWQDIEFKASGLIKTAEDQLCSVLYPHGACSFWDRTTFIDALRMHSLVFYGEDTQLGFAMQRMGKKISTDASIILQTEVPASFLGPPLNYYQQRVRSWEMGRMSMIPKFTSHLFRINGQRTITGFIAQKILQAYALYSILCDLIRVPLFVIMYSRPGFWQKYALFSLAPIIPPLFYKFIKARGRIDLEPALIPVLTFPIYKAIYQIVSCLGCLRCIFFYWPSFRHTKTIREWEMEEPFWLDDRFILDPGFLARQEAQGEAKADESDEKESTPSKEYADALREVRQIKDEAEDEEGADGIAALASRSEFDARSHASRALSTRSRMASINSIMHYDAASGISNPINEKQRRMEQQMVRLEGSVSRVESMLIELSKRM